MGVVTKLDGQVQLLGALRQQAIAVLYTVLCQGLGGSPGGGHTSGQQ